MRDDDPSAPSRHKMRNGIPTPFDGSLDAFDSTRVSGENENETCARSIPFDSLRARLGARGGPARRVLAVDDDENWIGLRGINPWSYSRFYSGIFSIGKRDIGVIFNGLGRV